MSIPKCPNFLVKIDKKEAFTFTNGVQKVKQANLCAVYVDDVFKYVEHFSFVGDEVDVYGKFEDINHLKIVCFDSCQAVLCDNVWKFMVVVRDFQIRDKRYEGNRTIFTVFPTFKDGIIDSHDSWVFTVPKRGITSSVKSDSCGRHIKIDVITH